MKIYHNPRCRKSRETLNLLKEKEIDVKVIEYLKETPTEEELREILNRLGKKPLEVIRKGEKIYKEQFKGKDYSDEEWIKIMVNNPILIERPIVVKDDKAVIGRSPENVNQLI